MPSSLVTSLTLDEEVEENNTSPAAAVDVYCSLLSDHSDINNMNVIIADVDPVVSNNNHINNNSHHSYNSLSDSNNNNNHDIIHSTFYYYYYNYCYYQPPTKISSLRCTIISILYILFSIGMGYKAGLQPGNDWRYFSWHPFCMTCGMIGLSGIGAVIKKVGGYTATKVSS